MISFAIAIDRARTALAQPEPVGPTDEELPILTGKWKAESVTMTPGGAFHLNLVRDSDRPRPARAAPQPDLRRPDRYELGDAILRAWRKHGQDSWCSIADDVLAELPALAQPEPVGVTDYQAEDLADALGFMDGYAEHEDGFYVCASNLGPLARAVLARWGRPTITPIPVSERLPGAEDCWPDGRCWVLSAAFTDDTDYGPVDYNNGWELCHCTAGDYCWLPAHALPLPTPEP